MKGSSTDAGAGVLSSTPPAVPAAQQQHKPALILGTCKRKNIKVSWKKLDFVLRMVRKSYVDDAMAQLHANPKKAAMYAQHALANARSNAIYAGADPAKLWVAEAFVTKAKYDKQRNIMGRGYSSMKLTRYSHLNITVKQLEVGDVATAKRLHRRPKMTAPFMFREQQRWQQQPALAGGSSRSFTTS
jgi:ribosomal protein L22